MKRLLPLLLLLCATGINAQQNDSLDQERLIGVRHEVHAMFPGGDAAMRMYLAKNLRQVEGIERDVKVRPIYLTFVVEVDGTVSDVRVLRGVHPALDAEAVRVVQAMPPWEPATLHGKPIAMQYNLPVRFALCNGR
ncbi:MAG: TonB family protein [Flavobacteriales bacterium]|nr:TonB family protein [Flavobacteriales bacterium]